MPTIVLRLFRAVFVKDDADDVDDDDGVIVNIIVIATVIAVMVHVLSLSLSPSPRFALILLRSLAFQVLKSSKLFSRIMKSSAVF